MKKIILFFMAAMLAATAFSQTEKDTLAITGGQFTLRNGKGSQSVAPFNFVRFSLPDSTVFVGNSTSVIRFKSSYVKQFTIDGNAAALTVGAVVDSTRAHMGRGATSYLMSSPSNLATAYPPSKNIFLTAYLKPKIWQTKPFLSGLPH